MCYPRQMRERLRRMLERRTEIAGEVVEAHKEEIIALLVYQQFEEHVDSEGNPLRQYSPPYKKHKELAGRSGETDFNDTGVFQQEMNLTVVDGTMYIDSPATTDQGELKSIWLTEWNKRFGGADVMRLTPENLSRVWPIIEADFKERVNAELAFD